MWQLQFYLAMAHKAEVKNCDYKYNLCAFALPLLFHLLQENGFGGDKHWLVFLEYVHANYTFFPLKRDKF